MRHNAAYYYDLGAVGDGKGGTQTADKLVEQADHGRASFRYLHRIYTM